MQIIIFLIQFCFMFGSIKALNCSIGFEIESDLVTRSSWESQECLGDGSQRCLKSKGRIIVHGEYKGKRIIMFWIIYRCFAI